MSPFTASQMLTLLESKQIFEGMSDAVLRAESSGLQHKENGRYSVFHIEGMDVTDSITLISKDGALFYANFGSCSDSKTFFRSSTEYFRYLLSTK